MKNSILIVGLGNRLMADDGAGPAVIDRLRQRGLPDRVRAEEAGTDALRLAGLWQEEEGIWLVDALQGRGTAGDVTLLEHEEILGLPQRHASAHRLSLPGCLRWLSVARPGMAAVRYRLWGITPARLEPVEGLSPAVAEAVETLAAEILSALAH